MSRKFIKVCVGGRKPDAYDENGKGGGGGIEKDKKI